MILSLLLCLIAAQAHKPDTFFWGTATAAYQIEGYTDAEGRQPSVWDTFAEPEKHHVQKNATGDPADEDYVRYPESIQLLTDMGVSSYRMSLSWTRIVNNQTEENPKGTVNFQGVNHYITLMKAFNAANISLAVTLWHWDTPNDLEEKYGGFLNSDLLPIFFGEYATYCYYFFGPYVRYWATLNEAYTLFSAGYIAGVHAPGHCDDRSRCPKGDSKTEPYQVLYTQLKAHGHAVKKFRSWQKLCADGEHKPNYQCHESEIGIVLNADWGEPYTDSDEDRQAAYRFMVFQNFMYFEPIYTGKWPQSLVDGVGDRLPTLTDDDVKLIKGSYDVYFQNFYTSQYVRASDKKDCGYSCDGQFESSHNRWDNGEPIGPASKANNWLFSTGFGLQKFQSLLTFKYPKVKIIVTENGWGDPDSDDLLEMLTDVDRCNYYRENIGNLTEGVQNGNKNVVGYFAWSLMDNFEWADGYTTRFGSTYVNYTSQERVPKLSFNWLRDNIFSSSKLPDLPLPECPSVEEYKAFLKN